jgi:hypothetical protein
MGIGSSGKVGKKWGTLPPSCPFFFFFSCFVFFVAARLLGSG